ncbi:hypothetical protein [Hoeflea sp. TYP-13]|uniref:hypothetical protein n=1 Tax=Hoeflea sp. TYP-13 TaxID=3230023 RepID=UPI0034C5BBD0
MTIPLYDWPAAVRPFASILVAPGNTIDGFISRASYQNDIPIAGARNQLRMEFNAHGESAGNYFAWAINNAQLARFLVPIRNTPQLASTAALAAAEVTHAQGNPFSTGQYFSTGYGFAFNPTIDVSAAAVEGANTIVLDETRWPDALTYGKIVGLGRGVYHVNDIDRDGTTVTISFSPPLRRDIAAGEHATLRPSLICRPQNLSTFIALFDPAQIVRPGAIVMNEVIDEAYL